MTNVMKGATKIVKYIQKSLKPLYFSQIFDVEPDRSILLACVNQSVVTIYLPSYLASRRNLTAMAFSLKHCIAFLLVYALMNL